LGAQARLLTAFRETDWGDKNACELTELWCLAYNSLCAQLIDGLKVETPYSGSITIFSSGLFAGDLSARSRFLQQTKKMCGGSNKDFAYSVVGHAFKAKLLLTCCIFSYTVSLANLKP